MSEAPDKLWQEYSQVFEGFDDLTLARWLAQTLGQLQGRVWRASHPLVAAYHLAAEVAHARQIWLKRLATIPAGFAEAPCCRAPALPLLTRDILNGGLVCEHCGEMLAAVEELPEELQKAFRNWADEYASVHAVAHWDDRQRRAVADYDKSYEDAATQAEQFLAAAGSQLAPKLLELYPAIIWEDQDECLEVQPEDIE